MEENLLKIKYNELLARYNKGAEYVAEHQEDEKAVEEVKKIETELSNIIQALPNITEKEKLEGFDLVELNHTDEPQIEGNTPVPVEQAREIDSNGRINGNGNVLSTFKDNWIIAERLAKSSLLPDEFKGRPENIIIALGMAEKMNMDPFTICQNLHIIRGKLSWSGAFCKTLIEQSGKYTDLDFIYFGNENSDNYGCYLEATRIKDGKRIQGNKVTVQLAKDEKWWSTNPKWRNMTAQMLRLQSSCVLC